MRVNGISSAELATELGMDSANVSRILAGRRTAPHGFVKRADDAIEKILDERE
jgi:predicted transcriptional regulator